jgi:glyoxylase-like metal-dependent hydrolase (beta-lactamase superfamily II)
MNWKRWAAVGVGVATLGCMGLGGMMASMFGGLVPVVDGQKVGRLTTVKDGYVAAFIGEAADGSIFLIDAGDDPEAKALLAALAARGKSADDVTAVFLTHGHQDHIRGCPTFSKAQIIALATEAPLISGEVTAKGPLSRMVTNDGSCRVSRGVSDGAIVDIGGTPVQAFALPGHTAGSAAWLVGGDTLALGDTASATTSGTMHSAPWIFNDDSHESAVSLAGLAARLPPGVDWLVPSHSGPIAGLEPLRAFTAP